MLKTGKEKMTGQIFYFKIQCYQELEMSVASKMHETWFSGRNRIIK